jgi:hypothetical protein
MQIYLLFNLVLIIFGCFLPWVHSAIFIVRLNGIEMMDGKVIFAISLFALFFFFFRWIRGKECLWGVYSVCGLMIIAVCGLDLYQFTQNRYPIGPGLYLSLLGGVQVFVCSLYSKLNPPRSESSTHHHEAGSTDV